MSKQYGQEALLFQAVHDYADAANIGGKSLSFWHVPEARDQLLAAVRKYCALLSTDDYARAIREADSAREPRFNVNAEPPVFPSWSDEQFAKYKAEFKGFVPECETCEFRPHIPGGQMPFPVVQLKQWRAVPGGWLRLCETCRAAESEI